MITKKVKCISVRPPEMSTSVAAPVSSPREAPTDRHVRDAPSQQAIAAKASRAANSPA